MINGKKKVIFVSPYFKPHSGGLENYVANIEGGLKGDWDTVVVTTANKGEGYKEEIIDGTKVYRLPVMFKLSNTPINPLWFFHLRKIFKKEKPDLINAHAPVPFIADIAALASGSIPFVLTYHAGEMRKKKMPEDLFIFLYENILLPITASKALKIICPSKFVIRDVLSRFENKSIVITPGVDTNIFKPSAEVVGEDKSVLFIARFANMQKMKGLFVLIEAMKSLPDVVLKVIGEKSNLSLKNVEFLGQKSVTETAHEMQKSSLLVLPSLAHAESFGMVLIEAMACRKPVVGTRIGGIPEVINHESDGLLVEASNPIELASAIKKIIDDKELAHKFADNGYRKATTEYLWSKKIDQTNQTFLEVLKQKEINQPKIFHISPYYPPHTGGLERVAKISAEGLYSKGYDVEVITTTQSGIKMGVSNDCGLKVKSLWSFEFAHTPIAPTFLWHLFVMPKRSIIHLHLSQAYFPELVLLVAKIRKIPFVVHFHLDVGPSGFMGKLFLFYKKLIWGPLLRNANFVIACSEDQTPILLNKYKVSKEKIKVIVNAVSQDFFSDRVYAVNKERLNILYIGRLSVQKRVERIIEAVSKLSIPYHLTIVGDGEDDAKLKKLVSDLKLTNISFEGKRNDVEMREYHKNNDLFVISSDREGTPLVVLEAMAAGLPIVGSDVIGIKDLIGDIGVLFKEPYAENLAKIIEDLWNNPQKLILMSEKSKEKSKQYGWARFIEQLEDVYSLIK